MDSIKMLNATFELPHMSDGDYLGWRFIGRFTLKLHTEFPFRGFRGRNTRVAVYRGGAVSGFEGTHTIRKSQNYHSVFQPLRVLKCWSVGWEVVYLTTIFQ
jgi:hypothetical protein